MILIWIAWKWTCARAGAVVPENLGTPRNVRLLTATARPWKWPSIAGQGFGFRSHPLSSQLTGKSPIGLSGRFLRYQLSRKWATLKAGLKRQGHAWGPLACSVGRICYSSSHLRAHKKNIQQVVPKTGYLVSGPLPICHDDFFPSRQVYQGEGPEEQYLVGPAVATFSPCSADTPG